MLPSCDSLAAHGRDDRHARRAQRDRARRGPAPRAGRDRRARRPAQRRSDRRGAGGARRGRRRPSTRSSSTPTTWPPSARRSTASCARHGRLDVVVVAFGILGDQARAERDAEHARAVVHTDYVAHVTVLTHLAQILRAQGHGTLVVFSSVAGARVRRANYVYGSAKAGLDGFASGLADALHGSGVRLLLVRPGFVIGRMTDGHGARAAVVDPRRRWPTPRSPRCGRDARRCGCRARCGRSSRSPGTAPRALWRRMPR